MGAVGRLAGPYPAADLRHALLDLVLEAPRHRLLALVGQLLHALNRGVGPRLGLRPPARGLHSSTFRFNLGALRGIVGAFMDCLGGV
jgi:hypothetical protein